MSSFSDEPGRPEVPDAAPSSTETRSGRRAAREAAAGAPAWSAASQAVVVGGISLIPARKYPGWLKQGLTWGSTGLVAAVALSPGAASGLLKALGTQDGDADHPQVSWMSRSAAAVVVGGLTYGTWRFAWWADEAAERALRRLCVPAPRVIMAVGAGALTYREARRDQRAHNQQAQAEQTRHRAQG